MIEIADCFEIKAALQAHIRALKVLSDDLTERSDEMARERHPSLEASIRFRRSLDASIRLFNVSSPEPAVESETSVKSRVLAKIASFLDDLIGTLPRIDQAIFSSNEYNWPLQFNNATLLISELKTGIDQILSELKVLDEAKHLLMQDVNNKNNDLRRVI